MCDEVEGQSPLILYRRYVHKQEALTDTCGWIVNHYGLDWFEETLKWKCILISRLGDGTGGWKPLLVENKISFILYSKYYGNPMSPPDLILS